jgi:putative tricarboxylic transport membrane protein
MRIKGKKDFYAGLMFIGWGLIFSIGAFNYPMGSALRMGPAYFPSVLGWILVALGVLITSWGLIHEGEAPRKTGWGGLLWILGSVMLFGLIVGPFNGGLVLACLAMMITSAYGGWEHVWKENIINAIVLTAATVGIFYYGLGLPFRLWPWSY